MPKTYTTSQAAKKVGVSRETIYQWLRSKQIPEPQQIKLGARTHYLWTNEDIIAARQHQFTKAIKRFGEGFPKFHQGKPIKRRARRKS